MSKKRSNFKGKVTADIDRRDSQQSNYGYLKIPKGIDIFKEEEGRMLFDIIPYQVTSESHLDRNDDLEIAIPRSLWYKKPIRIHRHVGVDDQTIICPTTEGHKCPICEYRKQLVNQKADKEEIKSLNYSSRVLYIVIPKEHDKYKETYHIWDIAYGNFQKSLDDELKEKPQFETFPDLEDGYKINPRFIEETLFGNKYFAASRVDFEERDYQYDEGDVLDEVPDLDEILEILGYKQIERMFLEEPEDEDETHEHKSNREKDEPKRKVKTNRKSESEDDDEKTTKRPSRRSKEPEDDDKDEKNETPTRRRRPQKEEDNECPNGHVYGQDNDKFKDCIKCDVWDKCYDAGE